jgi:hypothetical protein
MKRFNEYVAAVRRCPRVSWFESGISLATLKRNAPRTVEGYLVRKVRGGKVALVADFVLSNPYAVRRLAMQSTPPRLAGWLVRPVMEIEFTRCPECGSEKGHKILCKLGNDRAKQYQRTLSQTKRKTTRSSRKPFGRENKTFRLWQA